jgi:hypothetical protein
MYTTLNYYSRPIHCTYIKDGTFDVVLFFLQEEKNTVWSMPFYAFAS